MLETAVVRKNKDNNFLIIFPEREGHGDVCRAWVPTTTDEVPDITSHRLDWISRGTYLQETVEVDFLEADRILQLYAEEHASGKVFKAVQKWKR